MNNKINLLFLLLLSAQAFSDKYQDLEVVVAIDCGSPRNNQSPTGIDYHGDDYYFGNSNTADYTYNPTVQGQQIKYTFEPSIYYTERHGEKFGYDLPLRGSGKYTLVLKFIELYFSGPDDRIFDILLGDQVVVKDFSIVKQAGSKLAAYDEFIEFELKDGEIICNGKVIKNAYKFIGGKDRVVVQFHSGLRDLPKVDGIIVFEGFHRDELKKEQEELFYNWEENVQKEQEQQQIRQKIQQSQQERQEEIFDSDEFTPLGEILFSFKGAVISGTFIVCLLCLFVIDYKPTKKELKGNE